MRLLSPSLSFFFLSFFLALSLSLLSLSLFITLFSLSFFISLSVSILSLFYFSYHTFISISLSFFFSPCLSLSHSLSHIVYVIACVCARAYAYAQLQCWEKVLRKERAENSCVADSADKRGLFAVLFFHAKKSDLSIYTRNLIHLWRYKWTNLTHNYDDAENFVLMNVFTFSSWNSLSLSDKSADKREADHREGRGGFVVVKQKKFEKY